MMSNERQRQASTPVVGVMDNLKNRQKQKVALCKTKQKEKWKDVIMSTCL